MGCEIDDTKNQFAVDGASVVDVSTQFASTKVYVVPTDEELEIASQTASVADLIQVEKPRVVEEPIVEPSKDSAKPIGNVLFVDGGGATAPAELGLMFAAMTAHEKVVFSARAPRVCGPEAGAVSGGL